MHVKVMTLNLLYGEAVSPAGVWSARLPVVLEVLRSGADIIGLQEATAPQLADLAGALTEYTLVTGPESGETRLPHLVRRAAGLLRPGARRPSPGGDDAVQRAAISSEVLRASTHAHRLRGEHCAILYRTQRFQEVETSAFWLSHRPHDPGSVLPWTWLPRVVNWVRLQERDSLRHVTIYNAHLDFLPWSPLRSARILRQMLDSHWDRSPQILMGDFNAMRNSAAYRHLGRELKQGLHPPLLDAWLAATERRGPEGTYHGGTGRVRWSGRLDRILFRPGLRVEQASTLTHHQGDVYPSDHYPVLVDLRAT